MDYPDLSNLGDNSTIGAFLSLPNSSYPYFWAWIIAGIFFVVAFSSYFAEKKRKGSGNLLSSLAVASFVILILSTVGTVVGFITSDIMVRILVFCFMMIGIWFFFGRN